MIRNRRGFVPRISLRSLLCASVSAIALGAVSARAADLSALYKAPPPVPVLAGTTTVWAEGGAFWTGKDPAYYTEPTGYNDVLASFPSTVPVGTGGGFNAQVGWEAAIGVDYGFGGSPWHLSFDMRYGQAKAPGQSYSASSGPSVGTTTALAFESLGEREDHTVADIMFGREIGPNSLLKFGVRLADLTADIGNNASLSTCSPSGGCSPATSSALLSSDERSSFIGIGPRASFEGHYPLANNAWAIDYLAGAAALIGERQLETAGSVVCVTSASAGSPGVACTSTTSAFGSNALLSGLYSTQISDFTPVLNAEFSVALSYAFNPASHLSFGFRFDGYWDALKYVNGAGQFTNQERLYYGPFMRLSTKF